MKTLIILMLAVALSFAAGCTSKPKDMSLADYAKIENEILDTDMKDETKTTVLKKHGYTLQQYQEMEKKVESNDKLKEEIGAIRMKDNKSLKE